MVLTALRNLASKHTCAVCYSGVDNNSSQCSQCKLWVHKRWSTTTDWQVDDRNYVCPRFHGKVRPIDGRPLDVGGLCLIWRPPFATWVVCCAPVWVVAEPLPPGVVWSERSSGNSFLSSRKGARKGAHILRLFGYYKLHSSEIWGPNASDRLQLFSNNCSMIRWICGTKGRDETPLASLLQKIGIEDIAPFAVKTVSSGITLCIKSVTNLAVPGIRRRGKHRKTCSKCVMNDVRKCDQPGIDSQDTTRYSQIDMDENGWFVTDALYWKKAW